jgi:hypothetical protein
MVQELAAKLGRAPRLAEFYERTRMSTHQVRRHFGTFTRMLSASGVERQGPGVSLALEPLFLDWAEVTRKLGKIPTKADYAMAGKYSLRPYTRRYRSWGNVPQGLKEYAIRHQLTNEWHDVLKIIGDHVKAAGTSPGISGGALRAGKRSDRPVYGRPMFAPFSFAPTNEQGVLFVFGVVAHALGFTITRVQTEFPDVEAMREIGPNQCQRMHLELEYESRNFLTHMHPLDGCDGIVCWIDNWPECPLEVIELRTVVESLVVKKS